MMISQRSVGIAFLAVIVALAWTLMGWSMGLACSIATLAGGIFAEYRNRSDRKNRRARRNRREKGQ